MRQINNFSHLSAIKIINLRKSNFISLNGFSIIIVTWNGLHHLKNFLPSVAATNYPDFEIILADNNSTDESKEWVSEHYPEVKIAAFDNNYGYTGGNNRAVAYSEKEVLLFLNNDVEVPPNWLDGLNTTFESDTQIAATQPKIKAFKNKNFFEYAGAAGGFLDRLGYPFCRGRVLDHVEKDVGQYEDNVDIAWASGAALAIKKDVFEDLGGFDEDFQFHMEEIDLCWRTRNAGYRIVYTPESVVYHLGGGSLAMGSPRKVYFNFRNSLYMLWKNLPTKQLCVKLPLRLLLDVIAAIRALISGKFSEFGAIMRAQFSFYRNLKTLQKKRNLQRKQSSKGVLSPVSIIWKYFITGKKTYQKLMK